MKTSSRNTTDKKNNKKKRLYAVLWVDDYGCLKLRKKDIEWYHKNAGPISFALEWDDRCPWSFDLVFKSNSGEDFSYDYLSYHFHPIKYKGAKLPKKIYDSLRLYCLVYSSLRYFNTIFLKHFRLSKKVFRACLLLILLATFGVLYHLYFLNLLAFFILTVIYTIGVFLMIIWYHVQHPRNWEYPISDKEWIKKHILKAKEEFEKRGFEFPKVLRHGWNLPWKDSMKFYMKLGVIADASAVPVGVDKHPKIGDREIEWRLSQPYFASLNRDYDVPWSGKDEKDRGLLILPVNLGNISVYGFGEKEKKIIEELPDGGLVSCYIHPQDDFAPIKEWVKYLKENYDVKFISAIEAAEIYLQKLLNINKQNKKIR